MNNRHTRARKKGERGHANRQAGFTLLLAAIIATIVLALGSSIFNIAQKQVTLSSIGRDSQFAFYAADTAAECALYWDFRHTYFATSTPSGIDPSCDGSSLAPFTESSSKAEPYSYPYTLLSSQVTLFPDAPGSGELCAEVTVAKSLDETTGAVRTLIHADGYSTSCDSITTSARALQRSVELRY